jgi:hypothetical protein
VATATVTALRATTVVTQPDMMENAAAPVAPDDIYTALPPFYFINRGLPFRRRFILERVIQIYSLSAARKADKSVSEKLMAVW